MVLKEFRYLLVAKEFRLPHRLHTVQNLPQQQVGGRDTRKGEKPFPVLIVTLPGRPVLFVKFESFLALRTEDQAGNPLQTAPLGAAESLQRFGSLQAAAGGQQIRELLGLLLSSMRFFWVKPG